MNRAIIASLILCLSAGRLAAQDQTLLGDSTRHGGFGGPVLRFTQIAGKDALMVGGRGGFVLNGTFIIGGGGYGWQSDHVRGRDAAGAIHDLEFGYGGLELEYICHTHEVLHGSAQLLIGGGTVLQDRDEDPSARDDSFFLLEPGLNIEMNIARGIRVAAGVSYRFVNGVELPAFPNADLRGLAGILTFKFGKF